MSRTLVDIAYFTLIPLIVTYIVTRVILGVEDAGPYLVGAAFALSCRSILSDS